MSNALKVGVFGYYSYRNLGDNVMAFQVASHIKREGHHPIIFTKNSIDMENWGFDLCSDVEDFVKSVDLIFFGGGGLLIPGLRRSKPGGGGFSPDLRLVLDLANKNDVPMYGFSLGGIGKPLQDIVPEERQDLVKCLKYLTLRNREDVQLLEQAGTAGEFLEDMVWATPNFVDVQDSPKSQRRRVGMCLYRGRSSKFKTLRRIIELVVRMRQDIDFVFYEVNPNVNGDFGSIAAADNYPNCTRKTLIDVSEACKEVASLDLMMTTRLHIGVMAMSYGVPSVAFAGEAKTRLLYRNIGRGHLFWNLGEVHKFAYTFLFPGALSRLIDTAPLDRKIMERAQIHFQRMSEILQRERQH
ncbi:polysaccharide pyruvyl transferase family protein [Hoeflea sp. WL0058]|uniref:Polysaccharide pyruvyl transferase family protein n=1 Tax=Flavimaribacter sediminis TaxID=2865987 RepID=A0AAE3CZK0_9HYPH|nr:polysaccharide pyruvyl transferase family protein [Flavimaribacter sediminis]MBW8636729.1 polysaccharide pyruvyl transferase family protein [Flavimaribacter sediminis]